MTACSPGPTELWQWFVIVLSSVFVPFFLSFLIHFEHQLKHTRSSKMTMVMLMIVVALGIFIYLYNYFTPACGPMLF